MQSLYAKCFGSLFLPLCIASFSGKSSNHKAFYFNYHSRNFNSTISGTSDCDTSTFQMTYGGSGDDQILDLISTTGDNAVCAGKTNSFTTGNYDAWIFKTDKTGNILWSKTYGGSGDDFFKKIIQTSDGGYLAGGVTASFTIPQGQAFAVKTDASGNVQWSFVLNVDGSDARIILIKVTANGTMQWMKQYYSSDSDFGDCIKQSKDGDLVIGGFTLSFGLSSHYCYLMKVSITDGSLIWMKTFGSSGDAVVDWIVEDNQGNLFLSCEWNNMAAVFKTNQNGNIIWGKTYAWSGDQARGYNLQLTSDNGLILGVSDNNNNGAILKLDQNGNITWAHQYDAAGGNVNMEYPVYELPSTTGYFVGGYTNGNTNSSNNDGYLIKTDINGNTGTCKMESPTFIIDTLLPAEVNETWTIEAISGWQQVTLSTNSPSVVRKVVCPQCCISSDTTIDTSICEGESYTLPNDSVVSQSGTYPVKFTSSTGCDSIINIRLTINPSYNQTVYDSICPHEEYTLPDGTTVDSAGDYTSSLLTKAGCDSIIVTHLSYRSPLFIQYQDSICEGTSITLPNGKQITQAGTYGMILPSATGCDTFAIYNIAIKDAPAIHLISDTCLIAGQTLLLNPGQNYPQYEWQDGSTQPTYTVYAPGLYWVKVSNECGSVTDTIKVTMNCLPRIFIPSAFSPNGDGMNDVFRILNVHGQKLIFFNVYNRWGKLVFHTTNISQGWDGTLGGEPAAAGAYVYLVKIINLAGQQKIYKGSVLLIR